MLVDAGHIALEVLFRLAEHRFFHAVEHGPPGDGDGHGGHVVARNGALVPPPLESLELLLLALEVRNRVGVALDLLQVEQTGGRRIFDHGRERLGFLDVDVGQGTVLFHIEDGRHVAQGVVAVEFVVMEEAHHLRALDLVEMLGVFPCGDAGVGNHTAAVHAAVLDEKVHGLASQLVLDLVPHHGPAAHHGNRIQRGEGYAVSRGLQVGAVHPHIVERPETVDARGVHLHGRLRKQVYCGVCGCRPPFAGILIVVRRRTVFIRSSGCRGLGKRGFRKGGRRFRRSCGILFQRRQFAGSAHRLFYLLLTGGRLLGAELGQRVEEGIFAPLIGRVDFLLRILVTRHRAENHRIGSDEKRIHLVVLVLAVIGHGRTVQQVGHRRIGQVAQPVAKERRMVFRVEHADAREKLHFVRRTVTVGLRAPDFILLVHPIDVVPVAERAVLAGIPAAIRPDKGLVHPGMGLVPEDGLLLVGAVGQPVGLHQDRVHEQFDVLLEGKGFGTGVVCSVKSFDHIAVLGFHGAAVLEEGKTVLGVIVQLAGAETVSVLVEQLHQRALELGQAFGNQVGQLVARKHRFVLHQADVAVGLDDLGIHVPGGRIAEQVGIVVQEAGIALDTAVIDAVLRNLPGLFSTDQTHDRILRRRRLLLLLLPRLRKGRTGEDGRQQQGDDALGSGHDGLADPAFVLEIAAPEHRVDEDMGHLLLGLDELVDGLFRLLVVDRLQQLVVVGFKRGGMRRNNLLEVDDLVDRVAVAPLIVERLERFGNIALLHVADHGIVGRLQLVLFKIGRAAVRVGQQTAGDSRRTVLRIGSCRIGESERILHDQRADAVQPVESLNAVLRGVGRLDQDMPRVEHIAFACNHLDDMESVRGLHDLRNLSHLEGHGGIGKGGPEDCLREHTQLTALAHAARVL